MRRKRIGTRSYYMMKQVHNDDIDICTGCCFLSDRNDGVKCPERRDEVVMCQEWADDWLIDYIFVPATKQGIADYVAHKLEHS